ncbi:MAG: methyltransferase domain-containing protein [Gammaproteobacteria bacterium]|nr:methyltransferase domain-containing protein [Gammaproteobacteria bacterium]
MRAAAIPTGNHATAGRGRGTVAFWWLLARYHLFWLKKRDCDASLVVVIPVYSRPGNLKWILKAPLACRFVRRIVVSNANTGIDIRDYIPFSDPRLVAINEPRRYGVGIRWIRCLEQDSDFYLSFDDDLFLATETIHRLFEQVRSCPSAPAGIHGNIFVPDPDGSHRDPAGGRRRSGPVHALWGAFCCTREQLEHCKQLADRLAIHLPDTNNGEDILLSLSGTTLPRAVDLPWFACRTATTGIAIHKNHAGFDEQRKALFARILGDPMAAPLNQPSILRLNLGCGRDIRSGFINIDINELPGVDLVADLNHCELPFESDTVQEIICHDILEHVSNYPRLLREIYRVLVPGGIVRIKVPHFSSWCAYADPQHNRYFSIRTFDFFTSESSQPNYYDFAFRRIGLLKIAFEPSPFWNRWIQRLVNRSPRWQRAYERTPLRVFPALNIRADLEK